jgi:predicted porin
MAQSSVTLFGIVDTGVSYVNNTAQKADGSKANNYGMHTSGNQTSRLGLRGTEDLGGGLKAGFQLESGFESDTGAGSSSTGGMTFGRQSEVNLSGGFGMVRLGNFFPASYYATADYVSMHNHDTGSSSDALYRDPVWFSSPASLGSGNKIGYTSPNLGGLVLEAAVSLHEKAGAKKNGYDLAANYNLGALALGAGYSQVDDDKQLGLRALYTFGQFTVGGYYQRNDQDVIGTRNNYRLSGMYTLGASEFHVNLGRAAKWSKVADSAATQWTLGYNYNLSKRTKVYTYYTKVDNKAGADYVTGAAGADFSSFALGVRHNF